MSLTTGHHIWENLIQAADGSTSDSSRTVKSDFMELIERTWDSLTCVGVAHILSNTTLPYDHYCQASNFRVCVSHEI